MSAMFFSWELSDEDCVFFLVCFFFVWELSFFSSDVGGVG